MKIITDYRGLAIRLTDERLAHIHQHPEMAGFDSAIAETLLNPQTVIQSISDPQAELFCRYYLGTRVGDKWLCVVVKHERNDAFVVTAYLTDKPKQGVVLWPPSP